MRGRADLGAVQDGAQVHDEDQRQRSGDEARQANHQRVDIVDLLVVGIGSFGPSFNCLIPYPSISIGERYSCDGERRPGLKLPQRKPAGDLSTPRKRAEKSRAIVPQDHAEGVRTRRAVTRHGDAEALPKVQTLDDRESCGGLLHSICTPRNKAATTRLCVWRRRTQHVLSPTLHVPTTALSLSSRSHEAGMQRATCTPVHTAYCMPSVVATQGAYPIHSPMARRRVLPCGNSTRSLHIHPTRHHQPLRRMEASAPRPPPCLSPE